MAWPDAAPTCSAWAGLAASLAALGLSPCGARAERVEALAAGLPAEVSFARALPEGAPTVLLIEASPVRGRRLTDAAGVAWPIDVRPDRRATAAGFLTPGSLAVALAPDGGEARAELVVVRSVAERAGQVLQRVMAPSDARGEVSAVAADARRLFFAIGERLFRARNNEGKLGRPRPFATLDGTVLDLAHDGKGYLVALVAPRPTPAEAPASGAPNLVYFDPAASVGSPLETLSTELPGASRLAYSGGRADESRLFAIGPRGVYRLDAAIAADGAPACRPTPIAEVPAAVGLACGGANPLFVAADGRLLRITLDP